MSGAAWLGAALVAVALVAALVVAAILHLRYWERRLSVVVPYAEERRLPTADGSAIELRRLAASTPITDPTPVLLVHGLGANHRNLDVHPDLSLARHLAERGRDVWLLTLRSGRRDVRRGERLGFGAMARFDVPLGVQSVLEAVGARALDYVGFSMGGMLLYAALGDGVPPERVRRAVFIGSPGLVGSRRRLGRLAGAWRFGLPFRGAARLVAFLVDHVRTPFHGLVYNRRNAAPGLAAVAMMDTLADLPGELYRELTLMASAGGELRAGGAAVLPRLARVDVPALFVAGAADRLAPPPSVRVAFEAWGADVVPPPPKRWLLLAKEAGAHDDYGHGDLVIGAHLPDDLFAPVATFLAAR